MKFTTTRFGEIEFSEEVTLSFPDGVLGFPNDRRFILLEHNVEGSPFRWLQSLDDPDLAFIVVDPVLIEPRYQVEIDRDSATSIGTHQADACAVVAIVNVPHGNPLQMTANLKAPLVVNAETRVGRQLVLSSNLFQISAPVFPAINMNLNDDGGPEESPMAQRTAASG
jgi:flagellar assembly factor FliW